MNHNVPYSATHSWEEFSSLTPRFKEFAGKEESYLKVHMQYFPQRSRVIEVGCGSGRMLKVVAPLVGEAIGIEHEYLQIQSAESLLRDVNNVRIVYGDARDIPYTASYFHLAFSSFNTLGNQGYDKFRVLKEMRRVVKPKRSVIISVYAENAVEHQIELYKKMLSATGDKTTEIKVVNDFVIFESEVSGSHASERFSKDKLSRVFRDTGFTDFDIDKLTDFSYIVNARK